MKVTRLYIKFVHSIFKDMNMKDYTFDSDKWSWQFGGSGISIESKAESEPYESYFIPWTNVVVIQTRYILKKT